MDRQRTILLSIIGIMVIVVLFSIARSGPVGPAKQETIKIGIVAPLTGDIAFMGEGVKNGAELAIAGLMNTKHKYEVVIEDDAFKSKLTATAVEKLISVDKVRAIATITSPAGNVASPIAEKSGIIHFGMASDANVARGIYNFIHFTPPAEEAKTMVSELIKRKITRVAVVELKSQGVKAVREAFDAQIAGTSVKNVVDETFNAGETNFKTIIAKTTVEKPEIYLVLAFSPELEIFTKQLRDLHPEIPLTSIESFESTPNYDLFEGLWYVNAADSNDAFNTLYIKTYGKNPTLGSANAYDIVNLVVSATERASGTETPTNDQIVEELMKVKDYSGALGNLTIDKDGIVHSPAVVRMIKDGKPVTIGE